MSKKYYIETLGCPKNKADTREIDISLRETGFTPVLSSDDADILIINTCSFIQEATEETINTIFKAVNIKKNSSSKHPKALVVVGCFVQRYEKEIKKEIPEVDIVIGTGRYREIPLVINEYLSRSSANDFYTVSDKKKIFAKLPSAQNEPYSYIRIAQGCSRKCAFCVIPEIRGRFMPYNLEQVKKQFLNEKKLRGQLPVTEIILVSQDSISLDIGILESVIEYFSALDEVKWIRLHYLFPEKKIMKILELFHRYPKLVSYLDIPFQHISEKILKQMKRPSDAGLFREILQKGYDTRKNLEVRTSFIIGFPGETMRDIELVTDFLSMNRIDKLSLFSYSHEEGTYAAKNLSDNISLAIKAERINTIRSEHNILRQEYRKKLTGTVQEVIIDKLDAKDCEARRQQDSPVIDEVVFLSRQDLPEDIKTGDLVQVKINAAMEYDWIAEYVKK